MFGLDIFYDQVVPRAIVCSVPWGSHTTRRV